MYGSVISTQRLGGDLWRVVLGGEGLAEFVPSEFADSYVNCSFVPAGAPYQVPFETEQVKDLPRELRPFPRRITVRRWNEASRELTLDFVAHGDVGHAGVWARTAVAGDLLQMKGPGGDYSPRPEADAYLFVGDESALPAIAVCCERVPEGRPVTVVAEVNSIEGELDLTSPGDLRVVWVHRAGAADPERLLADAVAALPPQQGRVSAFVHGEAQETRLARRVVLRGGVDRDLFSSSPYWRRGLDDEQWRSVKKDFVRQTSADQV
jgi:NADPH-dependent ferric siderophore reductase